jgi:uncharacterized phage protein (TIGR01671 family)
MSNTTMYHLMKSLARTILMHLSNSTNTARIAVRRWIRRVTIMRDILFRGKRIDNGEWVEGWYSLDENGKTNIILSDGMYAGYWAEVDPATIGQYTGLTDKNGVKVFEGDILDWDGYKFKKQPVVTFGLHKVECCGCCYNYHRLIGFDLGISDIGDTDNCEVIGNIHDNPELLGGDDNV